MSSMTLTSQTLGILIGGLLPAVFFALGAPAIKASMQHGIGIGLYLIFLGLAVMIVGVGFHLYDQDTTVNVRSAAYAIVVGATWALGAGFVGIAVLRYPVPISKLAPLYNMNTLLAVLLSLWIFSEWQHVNVLKLLIGAVLVILGGTLVALA